MNSAQARPNWKLPALLTLALVAICVLALWLNNKYEPEKTAQETASKMPFPFKDQPIAKITLEGPKGRITLACLDMASKLCKPGDHSKWELQEPLRYPADESQVSSLLSTLNTLKADDVLSMNDEPAEKRAGLIGQYGLKAYPDGKRGQIRVTMILEGGKTATVSLGETHPVESKMYALRDSDESLVYLIPSHSKASVEKDLDQWRDKKLFSAHASSIKKFNFQGSKIKFSTERKDGKWTLDWNGQKIPGDVENIDNFLSVVMNTSAQKFVAEKKTDPAALKALAQAKPVITMKLEAEIPFTLEIFEKKEINKNEKDKGMQGKSILFARASNFEPLVEIEASAKEKLDKKIEDFQVAKLITSLERFDFKRIEFSGNKLGPKPLVFLKKDSNWTREGGGSLDPAKVDQFLEKISGNKITQVSPETKLPGAAANGITVKMGEGATGRNILFWQEKDQLRARLETLPNILTLETTLLTALPWTADFFDSKPGK